MMALTSGLYHMGTIPSASPSSTIFSRHADDEYVEQSLTDGRWSVITQQKHVMATVCPGRDEAVMKP